MQGGEANVDIEELPTPSSIRAIIGYAGAMGDFGYVN
jgi:hypothetical protein